MGRQIGEELHYGDLVHPEVYRDGKEEPDGRKEDEEEEESSHFCRSPVQPAIPDLLQVLLDHIFCDHHLLLVVDQDINELCVLVVCGIEYCTGTVDVTRSDDQLPSQLLTEVGSLLEVCSAFFLSLRNVSVDGGQFCGDVTRCW